MRHNTLTIDRDGRLRMASHNHDSAGWIIGRITDDLLSRGRFYALGRLRASAGVVSEPSGDDMRKHKSRRAYLAAALRDAGLLRRTS